MLIGYRSHKNDDYLQITESWCVKYIRWHFTNQPWIWRQCVPAKRWRLPTSLHGAKTQMNINHFHRHENLRSHMLQISLLVIKLVMVHNIDLLIRQTQAFQSKAQNSIPYISCAICGSQSGTGTCFTSTNYHSKTLHKHQRL